MENYTAVEFLKDLDEANQKIRAICEEMEARVKMVDPGGRLFFHGRDGVIREGLLSEYPFMAIGAMLNPSVETTWCIDSNGKVHMI